MAELYEFDDDINWQTDWFINRNFNYKWQMSIPQEEFLFKLINQ